MNDLIEFITNLKQTPHLEDNLDELSKLLKIIIDFHPDSIFINDKDGINIFANRAHLDVIGMKWEEWVGRPVYELVNTGLLSHSVVTRVIAEGRPATFLQKFSRGPLALCTANPVFDNKGQIQYVIGSSRIIEDLISLHNQLMEEQEKSSRYEATLQRIQSKEVAKYYTCTQSSVMRNVMDQSNKIGASEAVALLTGESGTGKEVIARLLHYNSKRRNQPFLAINCAALPEALVESEIFGYAGGAFTGANPKGKAGMFTLANHGTLFLDEIGELPLAAQAKFLRVLENMEIQPLGAGKTQHVDVRVIAATNKELRDRVAAGEFREDLFFRLSVAAIAVPPLRVRREDIDPLADFFLQKINAKYSHHKQLDPLVRDYFRNYPWPGNIRELKNVIERMVICSNNDIIGVNDLPDSSWDKYLMPEQSESRTGSMKSTINDLEKKMIMNAYQHYGSARKAAQSLGLPLSTFLRKLHRCEGRP
ncbi:MAG: sigma 54-interacting transcriptional regulator [Desulfarculales bacterium]|jgi:transcriptional regulator with PAS, ATPase and Fis domain|nr:sigma 54-interacting transcriptional regulator [Desulfarculales bacterium]